MAPGFTLDPQIEADSIPVYDMRLSTIRLMNDANFPWLLLIPRRAGMVELVDLDALDRTVVMDEIAKAATALRTVTECHKLNIATLGNQVRQLHFHIIARSETDPAWPNPVWGQCPPEAYPNGEQRELAVQIAEAIAPS